MPVIGHGVNQRDVTFESRQDKDKKKKVRTFLLL